MIKAKTNRVYGVGLTANKVSEIKWLGHSGRIQVSYELYSERMVYGQLYVNGRPVGANRNSSTTVAFKFTEDINIKSGDTITVYERLNDRFYTNDLSAKTGDFGWVQILRGLGGLGFELDY